MKPSLYVKAVGNAIGGTQRSVYKKAPLCNSKDKENNDVEAVIPTSRREGEPRWGWDGTSWGSQIPTKSKRMWSGPRQQTSMSTGHLQPSVQPDRLWLGGGFPSPVRAGV